jgi:hypothetical protein
MTRDRFERETKYRAAISAALEMLNGKFISPGDFSKIKEFFIKKYRPFFKK